LERMRACGFVRERETERKIAEAFDDVVSLREEGFVSKKKVLSQTFHSKLN